MEDPTCRYCADTFGNEGAKTTHERSCDENPVNTTTATAATAAGDDPGNDGDEPSVYDTHPPAESGGQVPATQQQQAQPPATQDQAQGQAVEQGLALGDMLSQAGSDDPHESAQARGKFMQLAGAAAARLGQNVIEDAKERQAQAEQARQRGEFQKADARACIECGGQILDPPTGEAFACPHCETPLVLTGEE